jgi:hypothetical protein
MGLWDQWTKYGTSGAKVDRWGQTSVNQQDGWDGTDGVWGDRWGLIAILLTGKVMM